MVVVKDDGRVEFKVVLLLPKVEVLLVLPADVEKEDDLPKAEVVEPVDVRVKEVVFPKVPVVPLVPRFKVDVEVCSGVVLLKALPDAEPNVFLSLFANAEEAGFEKAEDAGFENAEVAGFENAEVAGFENADVVGFENAELPAGLFKVLLDLKAPAVPVLLFLLLKVEVKADDDLLLLEAFPLLFEFVKAISHLNIVRILNVLNYSKTSSHIINYYVKKNRT